MPEPEGFWNGGRVLNLRIESAGMDRVGQLRVVVLDGTDCVAEMTAQPGIVVCFLITWLRRRLT
jgi:hypothetical protein